VLKSNYRSYFFAAVLAVAANVPAIAQTTNAAEPNAALNAVLDKVVAQEQELSRSLSKYSPLVETYIQNLGPDAELGVAPKSDKYFLGKLDMGRGMQRLSLLDEKGFAQGFRDKVGLMYSVKYLASGFAQMILIDGNQFDRNNYEFEFIRREFLGEVRCIVFDVTPKNKMQAGTFLGRIWVEDRDYHIVRFNGTYNKPEGAKMYFHFDSWREQMGPALWLPAYVYSEESDRSYFMSTRKLQFKSQTRIWGYNTGRSSAQNEFTALTVESDSVQDNGDAVEHASPVLSLRAWERQAEENVLQRLEKAGLLARLGEVDKVLTTVVNNLEITNELSVEPEVRCRVLMTSPLESFTVGHTIVLSRGLIDVLPDEASLAMVLAHELAHITLGHRLDTKYAFNDRMLFEDNEAVESLFMKRDEKEERQADQKAIEFLRKSPYQAKLAGAGLFLRALADHSKSLPNLLRGNFGNQLANRGDLRRMPELTQSAPKLEKGKVDQIAALPLGGRIRVNPWDNSIELIKTKAVGLLSAGEKLQFEVAPIFIYLTRQKSGSAEAGKNNNQ